MESVRDLFAVIGAGTVFVWLLMRATAFVQRFQRQPPSPLTDADIERVAREGDTVTAIRWHRELHNSKLPAARAAVEGMLTHQPQSQE